MSCARKWLGQITGVALSSINKFLAYGLIGMTPCPATPFLIRRPLLPPPPLRHTGHRPSLLLLSPLFSIPVCVPLSPFFRQIRFLVHDEPCCQLLAVVHLVPLVCAATWASTSAAPACDVPSWHLRSNREASDPAVGPYAPCTPPVAVMLLCRLVVTPRRKRHRKHRRCGHAHQVYGHRLGQRRSCPDENTSGARPRSFGCESQK